MKKIRNIITVIIVLVMTLSAGLAASTSVHRCWSDGPYYELNNNKDVWKRYYGCSHKKSYNYTGKSFANVRFDMYLTAPSGTNSVPGKIGFEPGVTIVKGTHFKFNNITNSSSYIYGYKDSIISENTSLNGSSYANNSSYNLNLGEGFYSLSGRLTDRYPGVTCTDSQNFYIGPYPTVSCKVDLFDDNVDTHYDSIKISNIKLKSTYRPQSLVFELYKDNTFISSYTTTASSTNSYSTGWNSTFNSIEKTKVKTSGVNLKPSEKINIRVRVVDGRGTGVTSLTAPNLPKYAKYSTTPVF